MSSEISAFDNERDKSASKQDAANRYLVFTLNGESFGIPLLKVKEVIGMTDVTSIPYAPSHFKGIMNLRGQVISVIDLRLKMQMKRADITGETSIIIIDLAPIFLGVIVDDVHSVMAIESANMSAAPDVEGQMKTRYLTGVAKKDKKLILLLDVDRILNVDDIKAIKNKNYSEAA